MIRYFLRYDNQEEYFRALCILFLPFRNERLEIHNQNVEDLYNRNKDKIEETRKRFEKHMGMVNRIKEAEKQKEMSKKSWKGDNESKNQVFWHKITQEIKPTLFIGYDNLESTEQVKKIIINGVDVDQTSDQENKISLLFEKSPFYAEAGGQIGDRGIIENTSFKFKVLDTIKRGEKVFDHFGHYFELFFF